MRFLVKSLGGLVAFGFMAGVFGLLAAMVVFSYFSRGLPSFEKLAKYEPPVITRLYTADGNLLAEYAKEKRIFVPLKAIPETVRHAFIAAEDKSFYSHKGVDVYGIARAVHENIQNYGTGKSLVGGSTITQQVVKNFLLTSEKSLERKIKEAILAYRISKIYSKDKILELYLNEIYLGNGSYGVAAAALNYFNKPLNELSVEEAALLAAMPKAPNHYDPRRFPEKALARRNYVIGRMFKDGYLSEFQAQKARMAPMVLEEREADTVADADFFAEEVRREIAQMYGSDALYTGGLTVKTTVDERLQAIADRALRDALVAYDRRYGYRGPLKRLDQMADWQLALQEAAETIDVPLYDEQKLAVVLAVGEKEAQIGFESGAKGTIALSELKWARMDLPGRRLGSTVRRASDVLTVGDVIIAAPLSGQAGQYGLHQLPEINGALVAMDPHNGRVLAMAGGYSYQASEFNRATQAKRQPGSAFKPFVYMAALENGFTPSTVVMDEPIEIEQGPGKPLWRPKNYGGKFLGPTTLRVGLEKSRNTMTVRLAKMLGIGRIINIAKRLGIYEGKLEENYSMVLGAKETTLLNMVTGYAQIANGGRKVEAALIERVDNRHGNIIYRRDDRPCPGCQVDASYAAEAQRPPRIDDSRQMVVDPRIAYQITSLLQGVATRGTAAKAKAIGKPVAGKTGTTNDSRDAWFIGYSPNLVVGIYIGYDTPSSLGNKETGGRVALPGFIQFMQEALKDTPAQPFRAPPGIRMIQVNRQTGLPPQDGGAQGNLINEAFVVGSPIYRPPLPADAAEEPELAYFQDDGLVDSGFDPYADWRDMPYYTTPEGALARDQRYRGEVIRRNQLGTQYPERRYYAPRENRMPDAMPPQGYDITAGAEQDPAMPPPVPSPDTVPAYRTPAERNFYEPGYGNKNSASPRRRGGPSVSPATNYGTGGLY